MSNKLKGNALLLITAFIWGTAFVAQKSGGELGAFTFNGIRTFVGGLFLLPFIFAGYSRKKKISEKPVPIFTKGDLIAGTVCGVLLFIAASLQQFGLAYTTAGKAAFITTLYVVFCPIFSIFLLKKGVRAIIWICVVLECIGLYLLCMQGDSFSIQFGDTLVLICAVAFSLQMIAVDYFIEKVDGLNLACLQFLISGAIGMVCMFIFERPVVPSEILSFWGPILYAGILSCGIGYTFQVLGQKYADPSIAALILCLESVFGVLAGAVVLHEVMSLREIMGCAIMFVAVILSNLPEKKEKLSEAD